MEGIFAQESVMFFGHYVMMYFLSYLSLMFPGIILLLSQIIVRFSFHIMGLHSICYILYFSDVLHSVFRVASPGTLSDAMFFIRFIVFGFFLMLFS